MSTALTFDPQNLEKLKLLLGSKPRALLLCHSNPDGDAIGATLSLHLGLQSLGIKNSMACIDPVPDNFKFLGNTDEFLKDFDLKDYDTVFFVDCGDRKMTRFHETKPQILGPEITKVDIDHHPSNDLWGDINFVITTASSSCEIVFNLLQQLEVKITPQMATALLLGIYTDTGNFMHQNTTPSAYKSAADLIRMGGTVSKISQNVFYSNDFRTFKLWGKVLKNLHMTEEGATILGVHQKDYDSIGAKRTDLAGIIDIINSMPESQYSVVLSEDEKGNVKASLRTRKADVDVKALAEKFGGGGHVKAAGFTVPNGHLKQEIKWKIVPNS